MFLNKQLNALSIGMLVETMCVISSYIKPVYQFKLFISALTLSPLLSAKLCHIQCTACFMQLDVGLNSKQRQRQNTDRFKCYLHLFNS